MGTYADYKNRQQPTAKAGTASVGSYAQYKERHAKGRADRLSSFLGTDFTQYIQDYNAFVNAAAADSEKVTYGNAASSLQSRNSMAGTLRDRASKMEMYLEANRESLTDEQYQNALSALRSASKGVNTVMDYYGNRARYYGQWDTEEAYRAAMESASAVDLTNSYDPSRNLQEGQAGWNDYVATQDRIAQNKMQTQEEKPLWEKLLGYLGDVQDTSLSVHTTQQVTKGYQEQEAAMQRPDDRWSDEQKYAFGYLWNQDKQSAYQYAYAVNNMLNKQQEQDQIQKIKELATKNLGAGAAHTVGAILSAPSGMADYLGDIIAQGALGYIPEADGQVSPFEYSQAVTSGISQKLNKDYGTLNEKIPIIGGKGLGDVYGLGTSIAQSSLAAFSGGSGQALVQFFGSSAAAGVDDALSRGAEGNKAVAYGTMLGLAEGLAEMIGVDRLMKIGASDTLRQLVNNLLKQGAAEGIEEGVTAILNNFTDNLVMGNKSNFYALVKQFMANGMSEEEAKRHAWTALAEGVAFDMLGGFVSGAAHAAPQTAYQTYQQKQSGAGKNTATQQPQQKPSLVDDIASRITTNRKNTAAEAQQSAEKAKQGNFSDLLDKVVADATGAPVDPIGAAVEAFRTSGTVTNKQATDILNSVNAVTKILEETGIKLPDTASGRRAAIKQAIADLAQKQATPPVDTEAKTDYDNKNAQGGIIDGTGTQSAQTLYRRGDTLTHEAQSRTRAETGDRSGIQSIVGETGKRFGSTVPVRQHHGLTAEAGDFSEADYIAPDVGSPLHEVQNTFLEAGIECRVVKASSWGRNHSAYSNNGIVYISEGIDPDTLATAFPHESTHIMKQDRFAPYLDFAERTPDMLDLRGANAAKLINLVAAHRKIDIFNMSQRQLTDLYDELNAIVYGMYKGGILSNSEFDYGDIVPGAFTDFEGYIQELESIHDQFRQQRNAPGSSVFALSETTNEAESTPAGESPKTGSLATPKDSASADNIAQPGENINTQNDTKHPSPDESVGAAPAGFDVYSNLQYQYGNKPDREGTVRDINVPKKDASGRRVSDLAANIYGNKITSDPMIEVLEQLIADGAFGADVKSLNATQEAAIKRVQQNGRTRSTINVQNAMSKGQYSDDLFAEVAVLYADAQVRLEYQEAGELAAMLAEIARVGGRILNICKITKRLTPDGQLAARLSIAENVNLRANKPGRKKKVNVEISEQTKQDFKNVSTAAEAVVTDAASSLSQALKADTDAAANAAVAAGIKAGESAARSAKRDGKSPATVETQETHIYDAIMEFVNSKTQKNITKTSGQHSTKALDALQRYYSDRDQFQQAWSAAQRKAEAELSGNEKAYGVLRQFLDTGGMAQDVMDTQDGSSVSRKAVRQAAKASDVDLQSLVSSSLQDRATALQKIQDYVSSHYIMDESAANQLARQLQESFYQELSQRQTRRLFAMFGQKDTANAKAVEDQFRELYNAGAFTKDAFISREALKKLFGHDGLVLSDEVLEQYGQISDARKAAMDQRIIQEIADQIPSDLKSALKKWRYTAMLTNPSTHIKNMAGNLGQFIIQHGLKDNLAAVIEAGVDKVSGGKLGRTKAVLNPLSKADQALVAVAWNDYGTIMNNDGEVAKRIKNGGRYYEMRSAVEESRTVWKLNDAEGEGTDKRIKRGVNKVLSGLEAVSDFNSAAMDAEDAFFGRNSYAFALAGYMKANNLTEITEDARAYAIAQAQESTFHDDSLIYQKVKKAVGDGNVVFPFVKTPANVTSRAIEYSPGSLAKFGYDLVKMAAQNKQADLDAGVKKMTGAQAINDLSKGITGSALWGVGAWLAAQGLLRIVGTGDEDKREYEGLMGYKDFTVCIGGKYFEADFLSPAILPIYTGAAVYETFQNFTDGKATFSDVLDAIYSFADPVLSSSMMSSLEGYMYAIRSMGTLSIGELTGTLVGKTLETWLSQFFPSLIRRMAAAGDNVSRQTYADPDNPFSAFFQSIQSGIPGLRDDMKAKYDIWGQEIKQDAADGDDPMSWLWRVITPSRQSDVHTTGIDGEINRLLEAGYDAIPTSKNSKTITVDGKKLRLTQDQYETYEREEGRAAYALAKRIIESADYKLLSDAQKKAALQAAYGYADELGKEAALPGSYERNVPKYLQAFTGTGEDVTNAIIRHTATGSAEKFTDLPIDSAAYISDLLDALKDAPREVKPDGSSYTDVRYVQRVETITGSDLTEEQQKQIMDKVLDDAAYAKYLKILDQGYSNDDYAAALRIYLDSEKTNTRTKKQVIVQEFVEELNLSRKEAEALYKLYSGAK